jgi:hypothetical protein
MSLATYPFDGALARYAFVEDNHDARKIADVTTYGRHATLSADGEWTDLGLRLDGTQYVTLPNRALIPAGLDFTIFLAAQVEIAPGSSPRPLVEWDNLVKVSVNNTDGLSIELHDDGVSGNYFPQVNTPFIVAARLNAQQRYMTVKVADKHRIVDAETDNQEAIYTFDARNGRMGNGFQGTLIYFASFSSYLSNGQMGEIFEYLRKTLLERGSDDLPQTHGNQFMDDLTFQVGFYQ